MANQIEFSQSGIDQLNKSLDRMVDALNRVEKAVKDLDKRKNVFSQLFGTRKNFDELVSSLNSIEKEAAERFNSLTKALSGLSTSLKDLPTPGRTKELFNNINDVVNRLGEMQGIPNIENSALKQVSSAFGAITRGLNSISDLKVTDKQINNFLDVFDKTTKALTQLKSVQNALPGIGSLEIVAKIFDLLGGGFSALERSAKKIGKGDVKKIAVTVGTLNGLLRLVSTLTTVVPGGQALAELSTVFDKLGTGFSGLARASRQINGAVVKTLAANFAKLILFFRTLSVVLNIIPGGRQLEAFATSLDRLGNGLRTLAKLGRDFRLDNAVFGVIQRFISILKPFVLSLRTVAGKEVPDIGRIFDGIVTAAER
ncbi:hypothetical protein LRY58_03415, partial [Candidatus Woesebacteria bacterium]|nr:hypothetical protein [Candidatus Woesebacteria bacterium]